MKANKCTTMQHTSVANASTTTKRAEKLIVKADAHKKSMHHSHGVIKGRKQGFEQSKAGCCWYIKQDGTKQRENFKKILENYTG